MATQESGSTPTGRAPGEAAAVDAAVGDAGRGGQRLPTSHRLQRALHEHDVSGERAIALAQGGIALFVLTLHIIARVGQHLNVPGAGAGPYAAPWASSWVILTLSLLLASSALRYFLTEAKRLPERTLDILNVTDIGIFLGLIWGYQFVYGHPAGGVLKAPTQALLFALVALRALRFHPRPVLTSGVVAVLGWAVLGLTAIIRDGSAELTRSYAEHLASYRILIGAEIERLVALAALVAFLAVATRNARKLLSRSAHASDYADALGAARSNLEEATSAKTRAETALAELDRREAELAEQNRRFDLALAHMSQGICMFDGNLRLTFCNDRYVAFYGLPEELAKPGTHVNDILAHRIATGAISGDPEAYAAARLAVVQAGKPAFDVHELSDKRIVAIAHRPLPDGGWVATHEDITELRRTEARLAHVARHDALTDLPNRTMLRERLIEALAPGHRAKGRLAVLMLDLDSFKDVNDTLGHPLGDALLKDVAQRLAACVGEADTVARLGGDEFAVIRLADEPATEAAGLCKRIGEAMAEPFDLGEHRAVVGVSIGIAVAPTDGVDADTLLKKVDLALHRAKSDGRGQYRFFEPEMDQHMRARRLLERDLRNALVNGEFELRYQPYVNLERDEVAGCEALLRWHHPERGMISPADFVPLAEETGLIVAIGEWTLREACRQAASWPEPVGVAVNMSAVQFKAGNPVQAVVSALAAAGLAASRLELEITETVLLQNSEAALAALRQLHELGVRLALDDFGTGYSSLSYLRSFPFDKIKIDRSFIADIAAGRPDSLAIVRSVARLGSSLGMVTTAEGVETREQFEAVRAEGCTEMQGYYFSAPRPAAEIDAILTAPARRAVSAA
jgi:diguanylate cyclase (GGDEF)-like protein